ncbi:hypothetical protein ACFVMC_13570 [Nocardia sp. NPDC127579]|uniref:hypothetical protein n=1 Tax=Nocardia sp. NPDC127579 TaxID=3345402 RepID=UPI00363A750B
MVSVVLLVVAGIEMWCVVRLWRSAEQSGRVLLLAVVGVGIAYDSAVFGLGTSIGEGALLHGLSVGRFAGHAVLTPLLLWWAVDRVGAGARWRLVAAVSTAGLVLWGLAGELAHVRLIPRSFADTVRYGAEHPAVPIPALVVSVALLAVGVILWRREGLRFPLIGVGALIVASGAAVACPPLGNAGEAAMFAALTCAELVRRNP